LIELFSKVYVGFACSVLLRCVSKVNNGASHRRFVAREGVAEAPADGGSIDEEGMVLSAAPPSGGTSIVIEGASNMMDLYTK
jgi:hypothetical protein